MKYKVNIQAPDKPEKREIGILDTITETIKCVGNRIFKKKRSNSERYYQLW